MRVRGVAGRVSRRAFTLVEVLVTSLVIGVLAAVVIPAVISQSAAADPTRIAQDLTSVKSGMEVFNQNVRPRQPGDIEDLVNTISTSDKGSDGTVYTAAQVAKWKGPYLEWTFDATATDATTVTIFSSASTADIRSALFRCPSAGSGYDTAENDEPCTIYTTTSGDLTDSYLSVKIAGIVFSSTDFNNLNAIFDGTNEADKKNDGLLRQNSSGNVFYLAVPYVSP